MLAMASCFEKVCFSAGVLYVKIRFRETGDAEPQGTEPLFSLGFVSRLRPSPSSKTVVSERLHGIFIA
ncbi:MAG TPA: hypothetical protein VE131_05155 [Terriglobales bacterium]|nr:hypothetical protein [Terriglobales bacterium]